MFYCCAAAAAYRISSAVVGAPQPLGGVAPLPLSLPSLPLPLLPLLLEAGAGAGTGAALRQCVSLLMKLLSLLVLLVLLVLVRRVPERSILKAAAGSSGRDWRMCLEDRGGQGERERERERD